MNIVYWSDFACPYCYIGETRLKKAISELHDEGALNENVSLRMRSFRLDPNADTAPSTDTVTRFAHKYRMSPMLAAHQVEKISDMGRREGLEFNYASSRSSNTMDAHRLTKLAYTIDEETAARVITALFKAYFAESKVLADKEILVNAGTAAGIDEAKIREMLAGDTFTEDVLEDEKKAHELGLTGVPYFEINGRGIPGAEQTAVFKRYILEALEG